MPHSSKVRVRLAPSPTGFVHIGTIRTAIYNYLFAKKHGGEFILRIEDTDRKRFVPGAVENLINVLETIGIVHDEGPYVEKLESDHDGKKCVASTEYPGIIECGEHGPYIQSERLDVYKKHAQQLLDEGKAYYCFCTPERLEEMRKEQAASKQMPKYDKRCLDLSQDEVEKNIADGLSAVIRLNIDPSRGNIVFDDAIRGQVSVSAATLDDQVLMKSDGFPTGVFAIVVDDELMNITHVIKGEEWLPTTPKQILIYEAFGWKVPKFAHLSLILNPDKSKLSKRQGDVAAEDYLKRGYLKEALINFLALLGWNPGEGSTQEVFSLEELVERFDFSHVHKAGAVFDIKKLDWLNAQYIKKLSLDELYTMSLPFWEQKAFYTHAAPEQKAEVYIKKVLTIEQERLARLDMVGEDNRFFFELADFDRELLRWKQNNDEETLEVLRQAENVLKDILEENWTRENINVILMEAAGEKRGDFLWPLRVALTGAKQSPSPFDVAWVIGKETTLTRLSQSINKF